MNKFIKIVLVQLLILVGGAPAMYAQEYDTELPKYFEIGDGAEWTSELLTLEEAVDGFRLTVFKTNIDTHTYNGYPFVTLAEVDITDADGNEVTYTATTNSLAADDGNGLAGLCDNNLVGNGHYHSAYSGHATIVPNDYVYIEFRFDTPQRAFKYRQVRRSNTYDYPLHFTLSPLGVEANPPFNPVNPSEPNGAGGGGNEGGDEGGNEGEEEEIVYYSVTVASNPALAANVSGSGSFQPGARVYINTSAKHSKYLFSHWTLNGEHYSNSRNFYYTVEAMDAAFVAHYDFVPESPVEPKPEQKPEPGEVVIESPLYVVTNNENVCSFNIASGGYYEYETWVELIAYVSEGYTFDGWYNGAVLVNRNSRFNFQMPANEVTLTAKVTKIPFDPANPSEPNGSQDDVQTTAKGDVNKDGAIDVLDIVAVVNYSLKASDENLSTYDITGDGVVDILDIVRVVNLSLE